MTYKLEKIVKDLVLRLRIINSEAILFYGVGDKDYHKRKEICEIYSQVLSEGDLKKSKELMEVATFKGEEIEKGYETGIACLYNNKVLGIFYDQLGFDGSALKNYITNIMICHRFEEIIDRETRKKFLAESYLYASKFYLRHNFPIKGMMYLFHALFVWKSLKKLPDFVIKEIKERKITESNYPYKIYNLSIYGENILLLTKEVKK